MRRAVAVLVLVAAVGVLATPASAKPKPNEACRKVATLTRALVSLDDPGPAATYAEAAKLLTRLKHQKPDVLKEAHKIGRRMAKAESLLARRTALERAKLFCTY